ncbi:glucocorticoid modulatory element-binding protein 2 [Hyla sarda]|uniref:glucocorticoid modulatory element-binding protein 2 n=1 Tax=Hyla sarda TaxID=327740 RepID=UPI0024C2CA1D|nr:glucocorticoid modulatory element-binding protein 2 [Hyla sarda]XP_056403848.1 glucocorticoid modulatory element-binding protein 2 [Hyla sarda]XP_056403849.1 glucocorticoid modulatory element-binding protein 2 [Hyla sarda]XP_056403850.1 glucocorticoid modulatory element-binding protein 2 [Hyla sarda]XP_056403851.1 glucocorticoid modulatory element-binding protein 2 [Hyla sarda]XP_056403852.1 glucocorticoid modulatory element-binding protein 2 [Hyla sarda]
MATPDVSVHVEEVVVVTTPDHIMDGSGVEEVKAVLVTTNSPVWNGQELRLPWVGSSDVSAPGVFRTLSEEALESENMAAAAAFTASTELKEAVLVKMGDEEEEALEAEIAYPITCGESKANLLWRKFVCPGINVKCVQYNDHLITPKEFVHLAGKSTLKDWKRAIRMNGVMLRKIMDSGDLDFFQHSKVCSNTCRSTKIDVTGSRLSLCSQVSTEYIPITTSSENFTVNGNPTTITIETCESSGEWGSTVADDTLGFWQGLRDAGLLGEVIQKFHQELLETMKGLKQRLQITPIQIPDAVLLNNIVQNFGMLDLIKKVLASHKSQMDRSREQYTRDLAALEQQCDEHRRRAKELKHKSQHLNNVLMTLTPVSVPTPVKRPRLTRATSGPATISSQVSSQQAQITLPQGMSISQLTGLPFSKVLSTSNSSSTVLNKNSNSQSNSPSSPVLGGYTILTPSGSNFPGTLEIHPDSSNLTVLSTAAMQDSNTVLKVVSPIQLLTLQGLGATIQNLAQIAPAGSTILALPCESGEGEEEHTTIEVTSLSEDQK